MLVVETLPTISSPQMAVETFTFQRTLVLSIWPFNIACGVLLRKQAVLASRPFRCENSESLVKVHLTWLPHVLAGSNSIFTSIYMLNSWLLTPHLVLIITEAMRENLQL